MRPGLLWLAFVDLRRAWLRSSLTAIAIGSAILALAFFGRQLGLRQTELRTAYERAGAASFVVDISGLQDNAIDSLTTELRALPRIKSVEAPYSGLAFGIVADTSFLVFQNERQAEYLGARTNVLGVDPEFDVSRDYYVDFHDTNPAAPHRVIGIPLLAGSAAAQQHPPASGEILVASDVAEYVGVQPGAAAEVELVYLGVSPPVIQRIDGIKLTGTFDVAGPDRGRFDPFWRLAAHGEEVLTVRRPDATDAFRTTLPTVMNSTVIRDFLARVKTEIAKRGIASPMRGRRAVTVSAASLKVVPLAEMAVSSLLQARGLRNTCDDVAAPGFCVRVPEQNNFAAALNQARKLEMGGRYFIVLLVMLLAIGGAGLQVQAVLARWYNYGVLQAVGFSQFQVLGYQVLHSLIVFTAAIGAATIISSLIPSAFAGSVRSFVSASVLALLAAGIAGLPVLLWPLSRRPAELLRRSA